MNSSMHICDNLLEIGWDLFKWNGSSILMKTLHSSPSLILVMLFHFIPFWYICSIQAGIFSRSMKVLGLQCGSLMFIPVLEALFFMMINFSLVWRYLDLSSSTLFSFICFVSNHFMKKCVENILISGVKTLSHLILCSFVKYSPQGHLQGSFDISHSNWFAVTWSTVKIIWGHHNFFKNSILSSLVPSVISLANNFNYSRNAVRIWKNRSKSKKNLI